MEVKHISQASTERLHLLFLDGMRGLAAFYVVLFHVIGNGRRELAFSDAGFNVLRFGHEAVVIFIVLSGFVLTLPLRRTADLRLPDGLAGFVRRRALRILPAYYASLLMLPLFFLTIEVLKYLTGEGADWLRLTNAYINWDMLSHLLLLHNVSPEWVNSINPVLWSLSTEWWIYFVFALLLLPVWRRFGLIATVFFCIALSLVPTVLLLMRVRTLYGSPHLLAGFGLGMGAAGLLFSDDGLARIRRNRTRLTAVMVLTFLSFIVISAGLPHIRMRPYTVWITDLALAVVCALFILLAASAALNEAKRRGITATVLGFLESRPLIALGRFSYSLYLTHLAVWAMLGVTLKLAPVRRFVDVSLESMAARVFVVIPVLLLFAYGFYVFFEKPYLHSRTKPIALRHDSQVAGG